MKETRRGATGFSDCAGTDNSAGPVPGFLLMTVRWPISVVRDLKSGILESGMVN